MHFNKCKEIFLKDHESKTLVNISTKILNKYFNKIFPCSFDLEQLSLLLYNEWEKYMDCNPYKPTS